jgi:hypothetical protein
MKIFFDAGANVERKTLIQFLAFLAPWRFNDAL